MMKRKVMILFRYIPQYRREFYELLRDRLANDDIELVLVYGQPGPEDANKKDAVDIPWGIQIRNHIFKIFGKYFYWQPVLGIIKDVDLVILEQATRMLVNYPLLLLGKMGKIKTSFWAHGRNFKEETATFLGEWIKKKYSTQVDWWFAYNNLSARVVADLGFPQERITNVQNTLNTRTLSDSMKLLQAKDVERYRSEIGIRGQHTGLYIGSMYPEKKIGFLLESCELIRAAVPDFEIIFIGSGEDDYLVKEKARTNPYIHYVGPKFEQEKIPYFACAQLLLIPGAVGLVVLDSFALGIPLVTCANLNHGPEVAYLEDGVNGVIVKNSKSQEAYAQAVTDVLLNAEKHASLVKGCCISREEYTLEKMVEYFAEGVCLAVES